MKLVYINGLGPNFKGDNMYEFIFSDDLENVWGESWDSQPCNGSPKPPDLEYVKKVGVLKNTQIDLELIQNSDFFSFTDAIDNIIALGWEKENEENLNKSKSRLVFHFGNTEKEVKDKLYERDIILEIEKTLSHEF